MNFFEAVIHLTRAGMKLEFTPHEEHPRIRGTVVQLIADLSPEDPKTVFTPENQRLSEPATPMEAEAVRDMFRQAQRMRDGVG